MNNKNTKRALLTSVLSLAVCGSMLVGTTFAWFTDSVSSTNNVITTGNLDVELYYATAEDYASDKWTQVEAGTKVFDQDALYEPGYTELVYFKVKNAGSLALKYDMSFAYTETKGFNVLGEEFALSDYINARVIHWSEFDSLTRDTLPYFDAGWFQMEMGAPLSDFENAVSNTMDGWNETALESGEEIEVAVALWMDTTVGNEANHDGVNKPEINLSVNLVATQYTYEEDSFGDDYDEDVWKDVAEPVTPDENGVVYVYTAQQLAGVAADLTGVKTIEIMENIDLAGRLWTPIDIKSGYSALTIDGNGHTISNMTIDDIGGSDMRTYGTGFIGNLYAGSVTMNDLTFDNADVVSTGSFIGVAVGYAYYGSLYLNNVDVMNSTVASTAAKGIRVGALLGAKFMFDGAEKPTAEGFSVVDCDASGNTVTGYHNVGGLIGSILYGTARTNDTIKNCTVSDTTLIHTNINDWAANALACDGVNAVTDDDFVATNVISKAVATSGENLEATLENGATVYLTANEMTLPSLADFEGVTLIGAEGTVIGGENAATGFESNFGKDTTIKNVTFSGTTNGVRYSYAKGGNTTFDNCTFSGDSIYGFHIDQSNGATFTFNNCTFVGFNAFAGDLEKVIFNNCTFLSNGNYGHTNIWSVGEFNNCTWGDNTSVSPGSGGGTLYFNGVEESYHHEFIGSAESLVAFAESVNEGGDNWDGQKVLLVDDIDLTGIDWAPIGQTGGTTFSGSFNGQGHTIYNLTVDSSGEEGAHYSSGLFGWIEIHGSEYTVIENLNVVGATIVGNHNCGTIVGYATGSVEIKNCTVSNAKITCNVANDEANGDKAGVIAGNITAEPETKVTNCAADNSTVTAGRDAGQLVGAGNTENVTGTATNVTVTANGKGTGDNINNKLVGRDL